MAKLTAECEDLEVQETKAREARLDLKSALYRREGALEPAR